MPRPDNLLLIFEAHELQAVKAEIGRIGPIHFLDMRVSDEQEAEAAAGLRAMRLSDEQEVARARAGLRRSGSGSPATGA